MVNRKHAKHVSWNPIVRFRVIPALSEENSDLWWTKSDCIAARNRVMRRHSRLLVMKKSDEGSDDCDSDFSE